MKTSTLILLAAFTISPLMLQGQAKAASTDNNSTDGVSKIEKGEKPSESPGWLVLEEDWFYPLRFEPYYSLDSIRYHYRRKEERAAANKIESAVSWLKLAAGHAMPFTKQKLEAAAADLSLLADDLREGDVISAARLDDLLARSAHALSEWHYYKAKEEWGKNETQDAGADLQLAAQYLQHAANSARYQFGPDTVKVVTTLYDHGQATSEQTHFDHNTLGMHLQSIEKGLQELGDAISKK
ncbi:MAG: hypothetical protein KDA60_09875 [Planctomycetales bacterium]|nr:hypothetical protein [Planctomycetales bacterium]